MLSLLLGCWLTFFPESPKFLIECGETDEALAILRYMYQKNTGKGQTEYPVTCNSIKSRFSSLFMFNSLFSWIALVEMKKWLAYYDYHLLSPRYKRTFSCQIRLLATFCDSPEWLICRAYHDMNSSAITEIIT